MNYIIINLILIFNFITFEYYIQFLYLKIFQKYKNISIFFSKIFTNQFVIFYFLLYRIFHIKSGIVKKIRKNFHIPKIVIIFFLLLFLWVLGFNIY